MVGLDNKLYKVQGTYIKVVEMYFNYFSFCGSKWSCKQETLLPDAQTTNTYLRFGLYWWNCYRFWIFPLSIFGLLKFYFGLLNFYIRLLNF